MYCYIETPSRLRIFDINTPLKSLHFNTSTMHNFHYIQDNVYHNSGSPAELHRRDIYEKFFLKGNKNPYEHFYQDLTPPLVSDGPTTLYGQPRKNFTLAKRKISNIEIEGNKARIETIVEHVHDHTLFDAVKKVITVVFCDESNYNILRIGDEIYSHEGEKSVQTFLCNGDYCYLGGGYHERGLGYFGKKVEREDPYISVLCGNSANFRINEIREYWEKHKKSIFENMNSSCVSSEENLFFASNAFDLFQILGREMLYSRTPEKMTLEGYQQLDRASKRSVFCGTLLNTTEDLIRLIEKYPTLWTSETSKYFENGNVLFLEGIDIFTDYKFRLLPKPRKANLVYGVGPLFIENYEKKEDVDEFMKVYESLAESILISKNPCSPCSNINSKEEEEKKKILLMSLIGGRFQLQKRYETPEQHLDPDTKNFINIANNKPITKGCSKDLKVSEWYENTAQQYKRLENEMQLFKGMNPDDITLEKVEKEAKEKLQRMSKNFAEGMRKNRLLPAFIEKILSTPYDIEYDEIYISVPVGDIKIAEGKTVSVKKFDGPYGPGSQFMEKKNDY